MGRTADAAGRAPPCSAPVRCVACPGRLSAGSFAQRLGRDMLATLLRGFLVFPASVVRGGCTFLLAISALRWHICGRPSPNENPPL